MPAGARARSLRTRADPLPAHLAARRHTPRAANRPPLARAPSAADRGHSLHSRDDFIWCGASCERLTTLSLASPPCMPQNVTTWAGSDAARRNRLLRRKGRRIAIAEQLHRPWSASSSLNAAADDSASRLLGLLSAMRYDCKSRQVTQRAAAALPRGISSRLKQHTCDGSMAPAARQQQQLSSRGSTSSPGACGFDPRAALSRGRARK